LKSTPLNPVDCCTLGYNAAVIAIILAFRSRIPAWPVELARNAAMIGAALAIALVARDRPRLPWRLLRSLYPIAFFLFMYEQTGRINHGLIAGFLDSGFQRLESTVFGLHPAVRLAQWFPQRWIVEYMHFAYSTYYALFIGMALFLLLRRPAAALADYMFSLCCTFYVCYLIFIFLPVKGAASYGLASFPADGPFTGLMSRIYANYEIEGAAFPSSHVAIAVVTLIYAFLYARRAAWILAPLVASLTVATVYCRYHYGVDAIAGVALAAVLAPLWRRINPALRGT
jgi:membrane-associated phospholipid phosphatase